MAHAPGTIGVDQLMSIFESSTMRQQQRQAVPAAKKCPSCEDGDRPTTDRLCHICGDELVDIPRVVTAATTNNALSAAAGSNGVDFMDLLGTDLRAAIQASLEQAAPTRQISQEYLSTLGKVTLDSRRGLLHDVTLSIGPLLVMGTAATFGPLLATDAAIQDVPLIFGDPVCGETTDNLLSNSAHCAGAIVLLQRGKVSFAAKAKVAQASNAAALVVINTSDMWPFVMTDSANELDSFDLRIPVVMISQASGELVQGVMNSRQQTASSSSAGGTGGTGGTVGSGGSVGGAATGPLTGTLRYGRFEPECSICQEEMEAGSCVLKLACRHAYHKECVQTWLEGHNTCPLCRNEMPVSKTRKPPSQQQRDANAASDDGRMPYFH